MRSFNYSFLENEMFPAKLVNKLYSVAELHGRINLRKDGISDVLARIELEAINHPVSEDEYLSGLYREARARISNNYRRIDVSVDNILELYKVLTPNFHSMYDGYRNNLHPIKLPGEIKESVDFPTIHPKEISEAMHQLVNAYNEAVNNININQLLLIPCIILDFLCIRPFERGNKRMAQLLLLLLLCRNGFEVIKCVPFEEQISITKAEYDIAFKDSADNWHEGKNKYFPFIEYCLDILLLCYIELDKYKGQDAANAKKTTKTRFCYVFLAQYPGFA